jgi:hypothetical protein
MVQLLGDRANDHHAHSLGEGRQFFQLVGYIPRRVVRLDGDKQCLLGPLGGCLGCPKRARTLDVGFLLAFVAFIITEKFGLFQRAVVGAELFCQVRCCFVKWGYGGAPLCLRRSIEGLFFARCSLNFNQRWSTDPNSNIDHGCSPHWFFHTGPEYQFRCSIYCFAIHGSNLFSIFSK